MTTRSPFTAPRIGFAGLVAAVGLFLSGCATQPYGATSESRDPVTYAVILYLAEGEVLSAEERAYAMEFARDTLLASALIDPTDVMIDDPERAQLLFRARMEDGQLVEIAGVPTVTQGQTVVISNPRRSYDRIWWEASYPHGIPPYYGGRYDRFPYPGPGWGYPDRRGDRWHGGGGRGGYHRDGDRHDGDRRDQRPPRRGDDDDRSPGPRRPDVGQPNLGRPDRPYRGIPTVDRGETPPRNTPPSNRGRPTFTPPPAPAPAPAPPPAPEPSWDRGSNSRDRYTPPPPAPSRDRGTPTDRRRGRELN